MKKKPPIEQGDALSDDETTLLQSTANGVNTKTVTEVMDKGKRTIEGYRANILIKLGAANMYHAIAIAIRNRLIK